MVTCNDLVNSANYYNSVANAYKNAINKYCRNGTISHHGHHGDYGYNGHHSHYGQYGHDNHNDYNDHYDYRGYNPGYNLEHFSSIDGVERDLENNYRYLKDNNVNSYEYIVIFIIILVFLAILFYYR